MTNGCGYVCPKCEGKDYIESGELCDWCTTKEIISDETWLKEVHEGKCCSDEE